MKKENEVIELVLKFIHDSTSAEWRIIENPDEVERNSPACDAIASYNSKEIAIEHTSIDAVPFQREDDHRFNKLLGPLRTELYGKLPAPGDYLLIIPMNVIPTGIDWNDIRKRIKDWCQSVAANLQIGSPYTTPMHYICKKLKGVPFEVTLYRWPGVDGKFRIARFPPTDLIKESEKIILVAIISKGEKLRYYHDQNFRTMLVFEIKDFMLADPDMIGEAFIRVIENNNQLFIPDEIYLIETELKPYNVKCLKFDTSIYPNTCLSYL